LTGRSLFALIANNAEYDPSRAWGYYSAIKGAKVFLPPYCIGLNVTVVFVSAAGGGCDLLCACVLIAF